MNSKIAVGLIFLALLVGMLIGAFMFQIPPSNYQVIGLKTCHYANNLTDIVNAQSDLLARCMGTPNQFEFLGKINCSLLE